MACIDGRRHQVRRVTPWSVLCVKCNSKFWKPIWGHKK